uniref:Uncharacterized protein n=1 Tax=Laticauda laticaudata TaxID=8630 RepID=A0A8C5RQV2_LATLA
GNRGTAYTIFSLLGVLLLAGQAVTVYFVYQHDNQITKLTKNTQQLKLGSLTNMGAPSNFLLFWNKSLFSLLQFLKMENKLTNSTEDQVKRLLLRENPSRTFPELKSTFQENMGHLKIRMAYNDWKEFETWMHKWLIFQMAQKQDTEEKGMYARLVGNKQLLSMKFLEAKNEFIQLRANQSVIFYLCLPF